MATITPNRSLSLFESSSLPSIAVTLCLILRRVSSDTTRSTTANGGVASFEVSTSYFAIRGSYDGTPKENGKITINKTAPITLGQLTGGKTTLGSTVPLIVSEKTCCDLGEAITPGGGKIGNFQIDTAVKPGNEFSLANAKATQDKLLTGIATSKDGDISPAMATFAPSPKIKYQIQPKAVYHVAAGETFQTNEVTLIHDDSNTLSFK
ncbi:hypothetical protein QQX98_000904 [Neonectria punicea]|uniref:Uncharacterized protein n=1 Tax=Neonectria punicea TaxID=979145 RepID=A0ABR1HRC6_9HYPO